jgi:hypothetical protein
MIHRVGDSSCRANIGELANAFDACRVDETVFLGDENDFKMLDVGSNVMARTGTPLCSKISKENARDLRRVQAD